ncbi:protein kinase family protein [Bacillus timonensis]|nr:protein kinase family protein [Bacillus timonensis]
MTYEQLAKTVSYNKNILNQYKVVSFDKQLSLIGAGKSATVFRIKKSNLVIKVYYPPYEDLAQKEYFIYRKLKGMDTFPTCYSYGKNFLVLDYIEGKTLYQFLAEGRYIPTTIFQQLEESFQTIKQKYNLYPGDMHVKNILVSERNKVKVIDVARFNQQASDRRWIHLRNGYYSFYQKNLCPIRYSPWTINLFAFIYKAIFK